MPRTPLTWAADRWTLSPRALRAGTSAALITSVLIVLGGVIVRVTGSGLGCPEWPYCTSDSLIATPELGIHGVIEFGNRMVTGLLIAAVGWAIVAARLQKPRNRMLTRLTWSMFWLVIANAIAGGITVWMELNPWTVVSHFLLAMILLACASVSWHRSRYPGGTHQPSPLARLLSWVLVALSVLTIFVGTLVTGSGPHAGDSSEVPRMGFDWASITFVHGATALALFMVAALLAFRLRGESAGRAPLARLGILLLLLFTQLVLGIIQSFIGIPELLVAAHVVLAALIWVGSLRVLLEVDPTLWATR